MTTGDGIETGSRHESRNSLARATILSRSYAGRGHEGLPFGWDLERRLEIGRGLDAACLRQGDRRYDAGDEFPHAVTPLKQNALARSLVSAETQGGR
ncbi:MAG: hypothetical protein DCC49_02190 [Acidobacteria bacterium]|nr:MAG: hypothetical protein DCC49_02190 [Acidobacteriota bacterium]